MQSNYRPIGDYIQLVDERNKDLKIDLLLGLTINKLFIPSVANIVGANMRNYKIIRKNQFACSIMQVRRDGKMPVALLQKFDEAIISQAYPVFEVKDENILLPEFLMMWFSRPEFDREACFYAVGGVRGSLEWDDFCNMKLPIPSIETQRAIVAEYNSVKNRIALNNQLIQKLEETAQAIYKQWFVDFEFPDKNGKPYKSSGGKMVFNEELEKEIPEGWEVKPFTEIVKLSGGGTPDTNNGEYWNGDIPFFTPADVVDSFYSIQTEKNVTEKGLKNSNTKLYPKDTVFVTARGTVGAISISGCEMTMNQSCYAITGKNGMNQFFTHQISLSAIEKLKKEALGAVFAALVTKDFDSQILVEPDEDSIKLFGEKIEIVYDYILTIVKENQKLSELKGLLLSKLAKLEN
ncbi:type I restriction enzyme S subunit [Marinilabilia salmonicolor]|jgi:type I restriction enzyme S subunit|nr:type I restriction enzyme S subunit [Marinilabilia salmonicolor]